jgi:hypothetical protein
MFHKSLSSTWHSRLLTTLHLQMNRQLLFASRYTRIVTCRTAQKIHPLHNMGYPLLSCIRCRGMCLLGRCLAMGLWFTIYFDIRIPVSKTWKRANSWSYRDSMFLGASGLQFARSSKYFLQQEIFQSQTWQMKHTLCLLYILFGKSFGFKTVWPGESNCLFSKLVVENRCVNSDNFSYWKSLHTFVENHICPTV